MPMNYVVNPQQVKPDITMNKEKGFTEMELRWIFTDQNAPVKMCSVGHTVKVPGGHHRLHHHTNAEEIIIMLKGKAIERIGEKEFEITAGDCVVIPRGVVHSHKCIEPVETIFVYAGAGATSLEATGYVLDET